MRWPLRFLGITVVTLAIAGAGVVAKAEAGGPSGTWSPTDCKTCHEEKAFTNAFLHSHHAGLEQSCEKCHAGAADHVKAQMEGNAAAPGPSLKKLKPEEVTKTCLECHAKGNQVAWDGGVHDRRGVSCISCHSVHDYKSTRAQLKTARDSDNCFTCHQQIRAKSMRTSHHPIREGKLDCASCHNPHDATKPKMLKANWITEQCLTCHTEKRGPFLWEHAPVRENCALCHDPHGSNHDKLLVAKMPFLCQRCHLSTRHPGTLYDLTNTLAGRTVGAQTISNRAVEHACKNCHQNVHGSNAPSGPYLGR